MVNLLALSSIGLTATLNTNSAKPPAIQTPLGQPVSGGITETSKEEHFSRIIQDVNGGVHGVEFLDKEKKVRLKHEIEYRDSIVNGLKHWSGTEVEKIGTFFLVTKFEKQAKPLAIYRATGFSVTTTNDVYAYDEDGNVVFEKHGVPYKVSWVSDNGKAIVCFAESPSDYYEDNPPKFDKTVEANPPHGGIYVFSVSGQLLYQKAEDGMPESKIRLSPNGNWLAYRVANPKFDVVIVDLASATEYQVPIGLKAYKFSEVGNDGSLFIHKRKTVEKGGKNEGDLYEKEMVFSLKK